MASTTTRPSRATRTAPAPASRRVRDVVSTTGWALLPLRLFLGITFVFAGIQKLADPHFLRSSDPGSIQAQLHAATRFSPIGGMLHALEPHALLVGVVIALAELAVGIGALAGLWTRAAAVGGMLLAAGFLLAVSWHSDPYYLGPDIVFLFAWVPLAIAGAGSDPRLSLDARLRAASAKSLGLPPTEAVSLPFATVQRLCGGFDAGTCTYQRGRACGPVRCPALTMAPLSPAQEVDIERRLFLRRARTAGALAVGGLLGAGFISAIGRLFAGDAPATAATTGTLGSAPPSVPPPPTSPAAGPSTSTPATAGPVPAGTPIGRAASVPVGGAARFTDPTTGDPAYVVQPTTGRFEAFNALCTHAGCPVEFQRPNEFVCPCHGAVFASDTGAVLQGPARRPLETITVSEGPDGRLYVS